MTRFPSAGHLASWAGMCPGNNESAGKHKAGTTRKGDVWLRRALGQAAAAAARSKTGYLAARYRRLAARRGKLRAQVAVGHSILIASWHILSENVDYRDLGADHFLKRLDPERETRRLVARLHALGHRVTVEPAAA